MSDDHGRDDEPVVPLDAAVRVLRATQRAVRKQRRKGADARLLAQLQQQSERRAAAITERTTDG